MVSWYQYKPLGLYHLETKGLVTLSYHYIISLSKKYILYFSVVTTFKTTTAPLSEVFFPAVVLCNINQIRGSIFKRLGIGSNATVINLLFEEFYTGR